MGCGGSRADAIEPRYYESWTRETESTWLTNTDTEPPPPACGHESARAEAGLREQSAPPPGVLEDEKSTQTCIPMSSTASGIINTEKKTSCGTQCTKPMAHASGTVTQKQNGFRTAEKQEYKPVKKSLMLNGTPRKCPQKKLPLMLQKASDKLTATEESQKIVSIKELKRRWT